MNKIIDYRLKHCPCCGEEVTIGIYYNIYHPKNEENTNCIIATANGNLEMLYYDNVDELINDWNTKVINIGENNGE